MSKNNRMEPMSPKQRHRTHVKVATKKQILAHRKTGGKATFLGKILDRIKHSIIVVNFKALYLPKIISKVLSTYEICLYSSMFYLILRLFDAVPSGVNSFIGCVALYFGVEEFKAFIANNRGKL